MFSEAKPVELRRCFQCGQGFDRRLYPCGSTEGPRAYAKRKYCSARCAIEAGQPGRPHKRQRKIDPAEHPGPSTPKVTRVALQFLERDIPITEWETSRWKS